MGLGLIILAFLDWLRGRRFNPELSRAIDEATVLAESSDPTERAYGQWALKLLTRCIRY